MIEKRRREEIKIESKLISVCHWVLADFFSPFLTGYPIVNDPLYNHPVFGPEKGKGGLMGKTDEELIAQLISIHNAENWLGIEGEDSGGPSVDIFGPPLPPLPDSVGLGLGDRLSSAQSNEPSDLDVIRLEKPRSSSFLPSRTPFKTKKSTRFGR